MELFLPNAILDPLHGLVRLTRDELSLIDYPIFRRLRGTKQNGLLWLVFPSATHTRFEHSLGALFVADSMWHALLSNSQVSSAKTPPRVRTFESADQGQAVDLTSVNTTLRLRLYQVIRFAALTHDLGHGPLSHTFDQFAPTSGEVRRLLDDPRLSAIGDLAEVLTSYDQEKPSNEARVKHEVMSCIFFALCWYELKGGTSPDIPRAVTAAILGPKLYSAVAESDLRGWIPLAHDIVASAPADADRMDYLERDSRSLGVSYGLFDRNRLLKSLLCYRAKAGTREYRLGIKRSGLRAVENLVQARFELFVQVYYHKTNRAIELMLTEVAARAQRAGVKVLPADNLDSLVDSYVDLDDHQFLRLLRNADDGELTSLVADIQNRRLWKRVTEIAPVIKEGRVDAQETAKSGILRRDRLAARVLGDDLHMDQVPPKATKDLETGAALLQRDSDGVYAALSTETWPEASPIIRTLGLEEQAVVRIYLKSADPDRLRFVQSELLGLEKQRG
jgi:HD superfamily phosphohydrolase